MKRKLLLPALALSLLFSHRSAAQCTASLTSAGDCYPFTLTVNANYAMDTIIWRKDNTVVKTYIAILGSGTVVAGGNGQGSATNQLNQPFGLHVDKSGNVYVADFGNHRIQKWAPGATTGVTVAGGNGQGAAANQLNLPVGIFVDESGNIYISDCLNHRVQKWAPGATTGVTVAGGNGWGVAPNQLYMAGGIYVKGGDLYIMDGGNYRVQKWASGATAGVTVAGANGLGPGLNQIGNPTMNGNLFVDASDNIYISEYSNDRVTRWDAKATSGVVVAGGNGKGAGANQFDNPTGLFMDNSGNIFVSEYKNHRVQFWPANATVGTTVAGGNGAGSALNQISQPTGAVKVGNDLYVCEYGNHRVMKFTSGSPITNTYTVTEPGTYTAIIKNKAGCVDTVTFVADLPSPVLIDPATNVRFCEGEQFTLHASPHDSLSYQWLKDGRPTGNNRDSLVVIATGNYRVITNVKGSCVDTTAILKVTVDPAPVPVITNNDNVLSTGTFASYQWYKDGVAVAGATSQTYRYFGAGHYTVVVTDANGCSGTGAYHASVSVQGVSLTGDDVKVYPNPATDKLHITSPKPVCIAIYSVDGKLVLQQRNATTVDISSMATGMYILHISGADGLLIRTDKLLKSTK